MLTYELKKAPGVPLYEALYRCVRADILSGVLKPGEKLPSKRALAANLEVSKITVEGAYEQLLAEGYIRAREKVGYFVEAVERAEPKALPVSSEQQTPNQTYDIDLTANGSTGFPFSVWSRLQREVMLDLGHELLLPLPNQGLWALRHAIAEHLAGFRGMQVRPENILIGAGTDFLYNLLIQLLGRDKIYAVEEPGYNKIRRIYSANEVRCIGATLDSQGVLPSALGNAHVLHISPSHHFPTGLVTPMGRRLELLQWAGSDPDRYIIEDDYDSEFRFDAHPMPTMASLDRSGRVIYMNTFSKSLAPSIRISYMVLPDPLAERFRHDLGFYSCTVSSFEQYTLERFLRRGFFEKHINRMRKAYKARRNQVVAALRECPFAQKLTILEQDAGLHFLLKVATDLDDDALAAYCAKRGIRIRPLSSYYHGPVPETDRHCLVVNYSGLRDDRLELLKNKLQA
ncbi:MAG: PLP-dependent aminotransferase family protein [Oscillospiraceae bacterium]|nr:PLP-dependent aminotransferase family protein [Oscillospiraceae bacterium]